jgi:nucleoside-diphosphate-sugar epimerase
VLCAGGVFADRPGLGSYGVFNRLYSNNAAQLGYAPYIGDGSAVMALLHVDDAVAALLAVLVLTLDPASASRRASPEARWFNAGGQAVPWKTIAEVYGKALGKAPKQVPFDQAGFMAGYAVLIPACADQSSLYAQAHRVEYARQGLEADRAWVEADEDGPGEQHYAPARWCHSAAVKAG